MGRGFGGSVYRALEPDLERHFAAKVIDLSSGVLTHERLRDLAVAEVKALARLQNPHIVQIFELIGCPDGSIAVIMQWVDGLNLRKALRERGAMPPKLALDIVRQIANGLHEVHQHNLVHCDIKPGNVMLQRMPNDSYFATLIDFGIARVGGTDTSGAFVGTPQYCAPEQLLQTSPVDQRTDIYALGLVLYCALLGRSPYGQTSRERLEVTTWRPAPQLSDVVPDSYTSRLLDGLIQNMTATDPASRFNNIDEVIAVLEELIEDPQIQSESFHVRTVYTQSGDWNHETVANITPSKLKPNSD